MHRTDLMHAESQHVVQQDVGALHVVRFSIDPGYYREVRKCSVVVLPSEAVVTIYSPTGAGGERPVAVAIYGPGDAELGEFFPDQDGALDYRKGVRAVFADAVAAAVDLFDLGPRRN